MAIFLCAFHLTALARVVDPSHPKLDAKAVDDTRSDGKQTPYPPSDEADVSDHKDMA